MLALRLVNAIEQHAEQLTEAVVQALRTDPRTPSYRRLESQEDHVRVFAVVHNLGKWLDTRSDKDTENTYRNLGRKRFSEGIPLSEVVCALMLTKQIICHFIESEGWMDSALDLRQQVELYNRIGRFFERAIYFAVLSYEAVARSSTKMTAQSEPQKWKFVGEVFRKITTVHPERL
jgi:hypothetical protein